MSDPPPHNPDEPTQHPKPSPGASDERSGQGDGAGGPGGGGGAEPGGRDDPDRRGVLAWFAGNRVAANLLMILVLGGGAISMYQLRQEVFPELDPGSITVQVPYLGASPEEVEEGVLVKVEEAIIGVEGIERVRSVAAEGMGTVVAELEDYADNREVLNDIESAVARIDTFPDQTEEPVISEATNRVQVLSVVVHGGVPERTVKELADRMRDELTAMGNISQVEMAGVREYEISVEVSEEALRRHGLRFEDVARVVGGSSLDLPGGSVKTEGGEILIRTEGQRYTGEEFEDIILLSESDGTVVRLGDVAEVIDGFEDSDISMLFDGQRAAMLKVFRVGEQDAIDVADTVKAYVQQQQEAVPEGVSVSTWFDRSVFLQDRIELLTRNAYLGLMLVFLVLTLFLDFRLAFWTTLGIPISFLGAFWLMPALGVTINMISLFAFIVVLGIVVDDAIVVGENIFAMRQAGLPPLKAAVRGVREMAAPVTIAILTTVVAFTPLLFTAGEIGKIVRVIPIVVISVLLLSLVEALLILPAHLSRHQPSDTPGPLGRFQGWLRRGLDWWIRVPYRATLRLAVRWRYVTVAIAVAAFLATAGFVRGGHIEFVFFEAIDADNVVAELTMPQGTPVQRTEQVVRRLEAAAERVRQRLEKERGDGRPPLFEHISTTVGEQPFKRLQSGPGQDPAVGGTGDSHLAEVNIELLRAERREIRSTRVKNMWREEVGAIPGVSSLTFQSTFFSAGEPINVELAHRDFESLQAAVDRLKDRLQRYVGVSDVEDSFLPGKREMELALKPEGRMLGLTLRDLAEQVRSGFYGAEAQRVQRGRHDVKVMVRYPEAQRRSLGDIERMRIRLPDGTEVPFETVADVAYGRGYAEITRLDRRRIITVTADVDESVANANEINTDLEQRVIPSMQREWPGLNYRFGGEQAEQQESLTSLALNLGVAMMMIFILLGVQFRSYVQPLIIMSAIPFGLIGAVLGHVIMGLNLSFLSGFGVVALTGVVVNDSLIMIDLINRERGKRPLREVIMNCGARRFRPILLTTLTTFFGLTPMLLETSLQAQFLVPMAVSLAFGVLFATAITLILVPTLYMILEDVVEAVAKLLGMEVVEGELRRASPQ